MSIILRRVFIGICLFIGTLYSIYGGLIVIGVTINSWGWAGFFCAPLISLALLGVVIFFWHCFITSILNTKDSK